MKGWVNEFKAFILRGNVVDLAVAVVIGAAFGAVVVSLVQNVIMPIIGAFGGKPSFDQYYWIINGSQIKIGTFLTALVAFVILAAVIFFFVVKPVNWLMSRRKVELPIRRPTTAPTASAAFRFRRHAAHSAPPRCPRSRLPLLPEAEPHPQPSPPNPLP